VHVEHELLAVGRGELALLATSWWIRRERNGGSQNSER